MRDSSASVDSPAAAPSSNVPRPGGDVPDAARAGPRPGGLSSRRPDSELRAFFEFYLGEDRWIESRPGGPAPPEARPDKAKVVSRTMLALGAGLLMVVPVSGALFLAAGLLGLAIASEPPVSTATQPRPQSPSPTAP